MFNIEFYQDKAGREPIAEYLRDLNARADTSKEHRVRLKKILEYIEVLARHGTRAGAPYVKHIDGDIWELRPQSDRIFFFYWKNNTFIMLHHFAKNTQKTPSREIEQAKRNMADFLYRERS
jgi:phage-related protein